MSKPEYKDYERLINYVAWKWHHKTGIDHEELVAEGNLVFVKCSEDYDPELSKFSARLGTFLELHYQNMLNTQRCKKNFGFTVPFDNQPDWRGSDGDQDSGKDNISFSPSNYLSESENVEKEVMFKELIKGLPEDAKDVIKAIFDTPREIMEVLGITKITKNAIFRYFIEIKNWKQTKILNAFEHIQNVL